VNRQPDLAATLCGAESRIMNFHRPSCFRGRVFVLSWPVFSCFRGAVFVRSWRCFRLWWRVFRAFVFSWHVL